MLILDKVNMLFTIRQVYTFRPCTLSKFMAMVVCLISWSIKHSLATLSVPGSLNITVQQ